jgi:hypothetical protein
LFLSVGVVSTDTQPNYRKCVILKLNKDAIRSYTQTASRGPNLTEEIESFGVYDVYLEQYIAKKTGIMGVTVKISGEIPTLSDDGSWNDVGIHYTGKLSAIRLARAIDDKSKGHKDLLKAVLLQGQVLEALKDSEATTMVLALALFS